MSAEAGAEEPVTPPAAAEEGGQAVDDRRLLRSQYLAVKSLINDEKDEMASADSDKFRSIMDKVESLHQHVRRPREQIADAEALLDLASSLVTSVRSQSVLGITPCVFVGELLRKFGKRRGPNDEVASLNWVNVGIAASHVFMAAPGCGTMIGPMNTEVKPRRTRVTRKRTARPRGRACPQQLADPTEKTKSDTDKNMAAIFNLLRRKKNARLEHLVLNRTSFAQTVENVFALSFLVKDGRVEINVNDDGHHIVYPRNAPAASAIASGEVSYNHFVFRFDFKDWKLMKGIVAEGEELMPHRSSQLAPGTGSNNHSESEVPPVTPGTRVNDLPEPEVPLAEPGTRRNNRPEVDVPLATPGTGPNDHPEPEMPPAAPGTGQNDHPEPEVPLAAQGIPIRKLCRNRGLVFQDETIAAGAKEVMEDNKVTATRSPQAMEDKMIMHRKEINLTYKRRRLFQDN
ncbi:hypothetical protein ACP70R_043357 [Stipagrostis hirtigluma subsp. patula]